MARPQKQTVDYFPHDACASTLSDTITVLEKKYGAIGYAFWFKLLERLASADGHYIDCRNPTKWRVLAVKLGVDEFLGVEIMNLLVEMQAIDKELWDLRVIWCDNFIKRVATVYKNRRQETPLKPYFTGDNVISTGDNLVSTCNLNVETPQSKVNKSKVNNIDTVEIPEWIDKTIWDSFLEMRRVKKAFPTIHAQKLIIKELDKFRTNGDNPNDVLNQSVMNNWTGVFPLKKNGITTKLPESIRSSRYEPVN